MTTRDVLVVRTPKDDAPEHTDAMWQHDCAFLTTWHEDVARRKAMRRADDKSRAAQGPRPRGQATGSATRDPGSQHVLSGKRSKSNFHDAPTELLQLQLSRAIAEGDAKASKSIVEELTARRAEIKQYADSSVSAGLPSTGGGSRWQTINPAQFWAQDSAK